jgi:hypothetical protein
MIKAKLEQAVAPPEVKDGLGARFSADQKLVYASIENGKAILASPAFQKVFGTKVGTALADLGKRSFVVEAAAGGRAARQFARHFKGLGKFLTGSAEVLGSAAVAGATLMLHTDSMSRLDALGVECFFCGSNRPASYTPPDG